jgi:hypothetical protein
MKRLFWKLAAVGGGFYVFVGALLCMTIVAAPVGLALMIFGSLAMFGARNKRGFQKSQRPTVGASGLFCTNCGTEAAPTSRFCCVCGRRR